ncbi:MAG: transporter [Gammaproteobacteria bacterium]|nr:transporter [Gammaproteobacteria bacterium]
MTLNKLTGAMILAFASQVASASGFALIEQSASGQGLSYAGAAANAEDASVMWFNPAGLTEIEGSQLVMGAHVIAPKAEFTNNGSYVGSSANVISGSGDNGATIGFVPNFYWKGKLSDYDIGLGVTVPFGQHVSYDDQWVGRYHATETNLKTLNLNPAMAKKINDQLSIGFGLNAQYVNLIMESKLNNALVTGGVDTSTANAKLEADSWAFGYNLGLLYKVTESTDIGFGYRSSMIHNAKGSVDYSDNLNSNWLALKGLKDADIASTVNLPASASLSVKHGMTDTVTILADASWTKWSDYDSLVIEYDSAQADSDTRQNFKDSWRLSLGGIYQYNNDLKLRAGVAFDQTPVSNETNRSPRTPDSDRKWISFGAGYQLSKSMNLDVGYSHLFADTSKVNYTTDDVHYLVGSYDSSVDILSAQLVWKY